MATSLGAAQQRPHQQQQQQPRPARSARSSTAGRSQAAPRNVSVGGTTRRDGSATRHTNRVANNPNSGVREVGSRNAALTTPIRISDNAARWRRGTTPAAKAAPMAVAPASNTVRRRRSLTPARNCNPLEEGTSAKATEVKFSEDQEEQVSYPVLSASDLGASEPERQPSFDTLPLVQHLPTDGKELQGDSHLVSPSPTQQDGFPLDSGSMLSSPSPIHGAVGTALGMPAADWEDMMLLAKKPDLLAVAETTAVLAAADREGSTGGLAEANAGSESPSMTRRRHWSPGSPLTGHRSLDVDAVPIIASPQWRTDRRTVKESLTAAAVSEAVEQSGAHGEDIIGLSFHGSTGVKEKGLKNDVSMSDKQGYGSRMAAARVGDCLELRRCVEDMRRRMAGLADENSRLRTRLAAHAQCVDQLETSPGPCKYTDALPMEMLDSPLNASRGTQQHQIQNEANVDVGRLPWPKAPTAPSPSIAAAWVASGCLPAPTRSASSSRVCRSVTPGPLLGPCHAADNQLSARPRGSSVGLPAQPRSLQHERSAAKRPTSVPPSPSASARSLHAMASHTLAQAPALLRNPSDAALFLGSSSPRTGVGVPVQLGVTRCLSVPNLGKRHPTPVISIQTQAALPQPTIPYLQTAVTPPMPAAVPHRTPSTECFQAPTLTLPPPRVSVPLNCAQGTDITPPTTPTGAGPALSTAGLLVTSVRTRSNEQLPVPAHMCSTQFHIPQQVGPGAVPLSSASQLTTPRTTSHPTPRGSRPMSSVRVESPVMTRIITSASNGVYQFDWPHGHADENLQRRSPSPPHARSGSVSVSVASYVAAVPQTHAPPSQTVRDSRDGLHCSRKTNMPPAPGRKLTPGELHASKPVATETELRLMRLPSRSGSKTPEGRGQHASVRGRRHGALCCV